MNSIEQKRKDTIKEAQFDKTLQETKNQIEQINKCAVSYKINIIW